MKKEIWFDMDGTIADFYGVENWIYYLENENTFPYAEAKTLINPHILTALLNKLQKQGWKIGIISWTSKNSNSNFSNKIEIEKRNWLAKNFPSIVWDKIYIVKYGTNKYNVCGGGILFDDEEGNRKHWKDRAYAPNSITAVLNNIA